MNSKISPAGSAYLRHQETERTTGARKTSIKKERVENEETKHLLDELLRDDVRVIFFPILTRKRNAIFVEQVRQCDEVLTDIAFLVEWICFVFDASTVFFSLLWMISSGLRTPQ